MEFDCSGFDWDDGNRKKCEKHGLSIHAIESLFERPVAIFPAPEHSSQEDRFIAIGKTDDGRRVLIAFTLRKRVRGNAASSHQRTLHAQEGNRSL
jgi:uncharacterized protein